MRDTAWFRKHVRVGDVWEFSTKQYRVEEIDVPDVIGAYDGVKLHPLDEVHAADFTFAYFRFAANEVLWRCATPEGERVSPETPPNKMVVKYLKRHDTVAQQ